MTRITDIDIEVGKKLHQERLLNGFSRQEVAKEIGFTHQQLQKYEKGINRISVSRLVQFCKFYGKEVTYFINDTRNELQDESQRLQIEVSKNFARIKNSKHKIAINNMIREMVNK